MNKKRFQLFAASVLFLTTAVVSCEKDDPIDPVNTDPGQTPSCSFCPGESFSLDPNGMIDEVYAHQVPFHHVNGDQIPAEAAMSRTTSGFYGVNEGMSIAFDFSQLAMSCEAQKLTFVHAYFPGNAGPHGDEDLINIQLPGTPLIATPAGNLANELTPYGYTVVHHSIPGEIYMNQNGDSWSGMLDSMIVYGPAFETLTLGANLFESELRSICVAPQ
jgi:hypothetical protein